MSYQSASQFYNSSKFHFLKPDLSSKNLFEIGSLRKLSLHEDSLKPQTPRQRQRSIKPPPFGPLSARSVFRRARRVGVALTSPSIHRAADADCCPLKNPSAICTGRDGVSSGTDDGLVCYGFRLTERAQVGRADTRDYLLCGQIGSFRTRRRGSRACVRRGIDPPREYNSIDPTSDTPLRYNLQFCVSGAKGYGGGET